MYVFFAWMVNFAIFGLVAVAIGGDAINGHTTDGHYYLANHGRLTEVTKGVYFYSYAHCLSVFVLAPVVIIAAIADRFSKRKVTTRH